MLFVLMEDLHILVEDQYNMLYDLNKGKSIDSINKKRIAGKIVYKIKIKSYSSELR